MQDAVATDVVLDINAVVVVVVDDDDDDDDDLM